MYVAIAGEDRISVCTLNPETGKIEPKSHFTVPGGPATLAIDPERRFLYAGCDSRYTGSTSSADAAARATSVGVVSSYQIDWKTGGLTPINTMSLQSTPAYIAVDRKGKFLLSACYFAGKLAVYRIGNNGRIGSAVQWLDTGGGIHSVQTDPSNRFVFAPHVALDEINKTRWANISSSNYILPHGSSTILQLKFDETTGHLTLNSPDRVTMGKGVGPRHLCFHPNKDILYCSNEQGSSVSAYRFNSEVGTLGVFQTVSTLLEDFKGENSCSAIRITNSGRFVYVLNRGHDSVACFSTDPADGRLTLVKTVPTEERPRELGLDPDSNFLFVVGRSGRMASYRVVEDTILQPLETYTIGKNPMWVLVTSLPPRKNCLQVTSLLTRRGSIPDAIT
ncbi:lactonase family protein [Chloroflexota bacterium]